MDHLDSKQALCRTKDIVLTKLVRHLTVKLVWQKLMQNSTTVVAAVGFVTVETDGRSTRVTPR